MRRVVDMCHNTPAFSRITAFTVLGIALLYTPSFGQESSSAAHPPNTASAKTVKLAHPQIALKDENGKSVLVTGKPISTRQSCGGDCHDYEFITNSFHFQQGKNEMDRSLLSSHSAAAFNTSPGMFGKFSIIPNRQLTSADIKDPSDADMSQPEWLTKCGGCHTGAGISEYDLRGHHFLTADAKPTG